MKSKKFKRAWKKILSMMMAVCMLLSVIPLSGSAARETATPGDASGEGGLKVMADLQTGIDAAGLTYELYADAACKEHVYTFVLSADGNAYEDADKAPVCYTDTVPEGADAAVAKLPAGTYYLQMQETLYESADSVTTQGIPYVLKPEKVTVKTDVVRTYALLTPAVATPGDASDVTYIVTEDALDTEEPAETEELAETEETVATPTDAVEVSTEVTSEVITEATESESTTSTEAESDEQQKVTYVFESVMEIVSPFQFFANGGTVYYMYGGFRTYNMYDASGNFVRKAYCGWQNGWEPIPERGITASNKLKVTEAVETDTGIRKILYYGPDDISMSLYLDNYNVHHRGWANAGISGGYTSAVNAILAKDAPLTTAQAEVSLNKSKVSTSVDGENLKSGEVTVSGGNGGNEFTFKVPSGLTCYVKEKGASKYTKYAAKTKVTVGVGDKFYFTAPSAKKLGANDTTINFTATKEGFDAYRYVPDDTTKWQTFYYGSEPETYSAKLKIEWLDTTEGYFTLYKIPAGDITVDYSQYNMAGIQYGIYADKNKTTSSDREPSDAHGKTPAGIKKIVLSYNGNAYMDDDGKNIVFYDAASKEAYEDSGRTLSKMKWYKQVAKNTTYYYKEVSTLLKTGETNAYYYTGTGVSAEAKAAIIARAGKSVVTYTGYKVDSTVHKFTLTTSGDGVKAVVTAEDETVTGSVTLSKTLNGVKSTAVEGLVFKLYHVKNEGDTYGSTGAYKIGEFTANASGNCVPTLITKKAQNRGVTTTATGFTNVPRGWYYIVETSDSVNELGFVNDLGQRMQWKEITSDGATAAFSLNNTTDGKAKATKSYSGSASELKGVKFHLYKVSGSGGAYNEDNLVADFVHNGTKVVPNKANPNDKDKLDLGIKIGTGADADCFVNLPYGWYCLVEDATTAQERGFVPAAPVYLQCSASNRTLNFTMTNTRTGLLLKKQYDDTTIGALCNYSLAGAQYVVYKTTGDNVVPSLSAANYVATFTTDASGAGYVSDYNQSSYYTPANVKDGRAYKLSGVPLYTWLYIKETKASAGCELDGKAYYLYFTADNMTQTVTSKEPVKNDPLSIQIQKQDSVTGATSGDATLAGAQFTINYYDVPVSGMDAVTSYADIKDVTPTRTWVYETDEDGILWTDDVEKYALKDLCDDFYTNDDGTFVIPYGAITIEETKAPEGYTTNGVFYKDSLSGDVVSDANGLIFVVVDSETSLSRYFGTNTIIKSEVALRADLKLKKVDITTKEPLSGIQFKLTSLTTGESHIYTTDEDGVIDTKTAGYFFGTKEDTDVSSLLGALPYDTYELTELATETNESYRLVSPAVIDLTEASAYTDGYLYYDFGTVSNIPEPRISTQAFETESGLQMVPADETVAITDRVSYSYLTAGETYTVKGILFDADAGQPYVDASGNYVTGSRVFTLSEGYREYKEERCGTIDVSYSLDTTGLAGTTLVVAEFLYPGEHTDALTVKEDGSIDLTGVLQTHTGSYVKHDDLTDTMQTIYVPKIGTTALGVETETHYVLNSGIIKFRDEVRYENVLPGKTYELTADVMNQETGEALLDVDGNAIVATASFTPTEKSGTAYVDFTCDASKVDFRDTAIVLFETLTYNKITLAVHADLSDTDQQLYFPAVSSVLSESETGEHKALYGKHMNLTDTLDLTKIPVNEELTIKETLVNSRTGEVLKEGDKEITAEVKQSFESSTASVQLTFSFDGTKTDLLAEDGTLADVVAFVYVYDSAGNLIAVEEDLTNQNQTVTPYTEYTNVSVKKVWDDSDDKDGIRPATIDVCLFADGVQVGDVVELSEDNGWTYTWENLDRQKGGEDVVYTVDEAETTDGYTKTVTSEGTAFTITNSHTPDGPDAPDGPHTGDSTPVPIVLGLMIFSAFSVIILYSFKRKCFKRKN